MSSSRQRPLRLFLDAGVLIDGSFNRWGSCKGVLILASLRMQFRAVIAEPIDDEFRCAIESKVATLPPGNAQIVRDGIGRWMRVASPERVPWPSPEDILRYAHLLAAVRHRNDMPPVVAAVLARPDWVLSTNTDHWNQELAARTGLRIVTPFDFLSSLEPPQT